MNKYFFTGLLLFSTCLSAEKSLRKNFFEQEINQSISTLEKNSKTAKTSVQQLFELCHQGISPQYTVTSLSYESAPELHRVIKNKCILKEIDTDIYIYYSNDEENSDVKYAVHNNHASILLHKKTLAIRTTQQLEKTLDKVLSVIKDKLATHKNAQITKRSPIAISSAIWLMYSLLSHSAGVSSSVNSTINTLFAISVAYLATRPVTSFSYGNVTTELEENLFERSLDSEPKLLLHPETLPGVDEIRKIKEFIIDFKKRRELYASLDRDKLAMIRGESLN